ncbi:hypothetical protein SAMN04487941_1955 [Pontibacter akesuensis]|uniref:Uncharacterized protein n=1 Tax=Pontibacter akesuensis TaxID=388950 RepID=A0A1I7I6F3_9BACT|nr:hypothetical protein SAMN04487941_1955 [Pontibacter akesuensis]
MLYTILKYNIACRVNCKVSKGALYASWSHSGNPTKAGAKSAEFSEYVIYVTYKF